MRRASAALLVLLGLVAAAGRARGIDVRWVYPPPQALVSETPLAVFGYVDGPPVSTLSAQVLAEDPDAPPVRVPLYLFQGKVFSGTVPLTPGRNHVVVGDAVLPVLYRPEGAGDREGPFRRPRPHGGEFASCSPCHGLVEGRIALTQPVPELCTSCHELGTRSLRAVLRSNRHTDAVTPDCLACHLPHGGFEAHLLRTGEAPCRACHRQGGGASPVAPSPHRCTACHDPHASAFPAQLRGEPEALCRTCHPTVSAPASYPRSFHEPAEDGRCLACHVSHPGDAPALLRATAPELCRPCHREDPDDAHGPELAACSACHRGHRSDRPHLLTDRVAATCEGCHEPIPEGASTHPALRNGCAACHNPHRAPDAGGDEPLCATCHRLTEPAFQAAHGGLRMGSARQCQVCHEPHRSPFPTLLRGRVHYPLRTGGCNACHEQRQGRIVLRYEGSRTCTRCHGQITGTSAVVEEDKVHKPVYQMDCGACHDPHLGARDNLLREEPQALCGTCHGMVLRGVETIHGVFHDGGTCYTCHRPHISDFRPLLHRPERELCPRCHGEADPARPDPAAPFHGALTDGRCTGCHEPHGTNTESLLRDGRDALCAGCHGEGIRASGQGAFRFVHGPVGAGTCSACHELAHRHRAAGDAFLRTDRQELCALCHDTPEAHVPGRYRAKAREVRNDCLACHAPHGADNRFLLRDGS
ncbi:MAG: hypothetical protein Kow0092_11750 [Deferrisomatales bacterium]